MRFDTVEVLDRELDQHEFEQRYVARGRPVHIRALGTARRATETWSFDELRRREGDHKVFVENYADGIRGQKFVHTPMLMREYLDIVETDRADRKCWYLAETPLRQTLPTMHEEMPLPAFVPPSKITSRVVFIGRDTFSSAHYHALLEACLVQVVGRKRVILYEPGHPAMHPNRWYSSRHNHLSDRTVRVSDADDAWIEPQQGQPAALDCTLEPGDALFIPVHWWHLVYGLGSSISVTTFWRSRLRDLHAGFGARDVANRALLRGLIGLESASRKLNAHEHLHRLAVRLGVISSEEAATRR
jgi:hypothetical protein